MARNRSNPGLMLECAGLVLLPVLALGLVLLLVLVLEPVLLLVTTIGSW